MTTVAAPKGLIFDLGDVLLTWSPETATKIPAKTMYNILRSDTWAAYDCGKIDQETCYVQAAQQFGLSTAEVAEAFRQARASLRPNGRLVSLIRELKASTRGTVRIIAMSNISQEDYRCANLLNSICDFDLLSASAGSSRV